MEGEEGKKRRGRGGEEREGGRESERTSSNINISALTFSWLMSGRKMHFSRYSASFRGSCQYSACTKL